MKTLAILCVLSLSSCGLVSDLQQVAKDGKEMVAEFKQVYADAKVAADTNNDGKTTGSEWGAWIAGGGGVALLGLLLKVLGLAKQTDELYDKHNENKVAIASNTKAVG